MMTPISENPVQQSIRIGVTGHRFLAETGTLIASVDAVLNRIESTWPGTPLTVFSALAEGSDRLVVQRVLARPNAKLVAPLPMPEAEYIDDFQLPGSRQEFFDLLACAAEIVRLPQAATRPAAYQQSGQYVVDHCDIVIALWNGQPGAPAPAAPAPLWRSRGVEARPLAWIYAHNHAPCDATFTSCVSTSVPPAATQGIVTYENFRMPPC